MASGRELLRELLTAPPSEFTEVRTRLAREGAKELAKVRKPPLKLWAADRAVSARPDAAGRLSAATTRLQELERAIARGEKGAGADLREAAADQRRELDVLESEARRQLEEVNASHSAAIEARDIIRLAVLAGGETWADLADGVLAQVPGEGGDDAFGVAAAELPQPRAVDDSRDLDRLRRGREEAARLRREATRLKEAVQRLEDEVERARRRADEAEALAAEAEARL